MCGVLQPHSVCNISVPPFVGGYSRIFASFNIGGVLPYVHTLYKEIYSLWAPKIAAERNTHIDAF